MNYPLVIGNWKLNGNIDIINKLVSELHNNLSNINSCNIVLAPPVMYLHLVNNMIINSNITLGAQNVDINLYGNYTGEISAIMLKDVGTKYVLIGHSERRIYHNETNKDIALKFKIIKEINLIPVLCIGETEEENKAGKTEEVCANQIDVILNTLGILAMKNTVIAYEPIWAIGTGKSAIPKQVQLVHQFIRNYISMYNKDIANEIIIQYGGSVNDKNAFDLFSQPDIDGVLVGGASLKVDIFTSIIKAAVTAKKIN
ncbi:Triosephosphate isomerase [Serratia symbiotica]|nr:Triosephosphate isomerase [Serratia symbiotica]